MDIKKNVVELLNRQIPREYYSEYVYTAISVYFEGLGYFGIAKWLLDHGKEEHAHGDKFVEYLQDTKQKIVLAKMDAAETEYDCPMTAMKAVLTHEEFITESINEIVAAASKANDYATFFFLQWFVTEQIEEEKRVSDLILQMELAGDDLLFLDLEID